MKLDKHILEEKYENIRKNINKIKVM